MGLCTYSQPNSKYIIFSVYKGNSDDNFNHNIVKNILDTNDINYKELEGNYKGNKELSFIVNREHLPYIMCVAAYYKQESILLLHEPESQGLRKAYLLYLNDTTEYLGYLKQVSKERALDNDSYTYDPSTGVYYITTYEREVFK